MRAKRAKQYRKLMHQYALSFDFREPYQVLIDAGLIKDAARFKMRLGSLLENTLHGQIKPMITQCCIRHLYDAETCPEKDGWIEVAKQAERRRCGHHELDEPLSALECLESVVDPKGSRVNRHRYVVASQDPEVRQRMRAIAGVPLVYINRSVMILEPMAARTVEVRESDEKIKVRSGLKGRRGGTTNGGELKRKRDDEGEGSEEHTAALAEESGRPEPKKQRKAKGPKGPNPLSVKKAKKDNVKPAAKEMEDRQEEVPKAVPQARQTSDMALRPDARPDLTMDDAVEGSRKRKRKRKPKGESAMPDQSTVDAVLMERDDPLDVS